MDEGLDTASRQGFWPQALRAMTLGWELALPIFGGVLAGYYLDRWLETGPIFTLGLLMFGLSVSVYTIWCVVRRWEARQETAQPQDEEPTR